MTSIRGKMYFILALVFIVTLGTIIFIVQNKTNGIISELTINQARTANHTLVNYLKELEDRAIVLAELASKNENVVKPSFMTFAIAKSIPVDEYRLKTVLLYDLIKNCTDTNQREKLVLDNLKIYNLFRNSKEKNIELKLEYPFP